jgi:acyl-coenzyme A synthetase/AMP-(fatty) acid ligase
VTVALAAPGAHPRGEPLNLARALLEARALDPLSAGRPALSFIAGEHVQRWSYAKAWAATARAAQALLRAGLASGDRVVVALPHSPRYAFAFFGAIAAGLVPVPASPQLTAAELEFIADDAQAAALLAEPARAPAALADALLDPELLDAAAPDHGASARALPETRAEDAAYLQYTSGTTARPKGVLHAQRVLRGRTPMHGDAWQALRPDDVVLHAGALNWSYTLGVGLIDPWAVGAHALLAASGVEPGAWPALLARERVTIFAAVPTVFRQALKYGRPEDADLAALRHGLCAGEALPPAVAAEWRARAGSELYEALGMTEVSTYVSSGPGVPVRPGSPGRAQPGRRIAVLPDDPAAGDVPVPRGEPGLLAVHRSDPGLMLGYWRRTEEEAAVLRGEWFVGGDRATLDADGYVWFQGRADDLIKSFGYRLSPVEIEAALASCPGVAEVAVVGVPLGTDKTIVTACVVPEPGAAPDAAALAAHAERQLAAYKRPHEYRLVAALPRTANGKLLRRTLLAELQRG